MERTFDREPVSPISSTTSVLLTPGEDAEDTDNTSYVNVTEHDDSEKIDNLEQCLFDYQGFTDFLIDGYNSFVNKLKGDLLKDLHGTITSGGHVYKFYVEDVFIHPPTITELDIYGRTEKSLDPHYARLNKKTYGSPVTGSIIIILATPGYEPVVISVSRNISLFILPIMLGSSLCVLGGKTGKELLKYNECATDPLGYFVIDGKEKVIMIQVRSRSCKQLMYVDNRKDKKNAIINVMTSNGVYNTSMITVSLEHEHKRSPTDIYKIHMGFLSKPVNVFLLLFVMIKNDNGELLLKYLLEAAPPEYYNKLKVELYPSMISYKIIPDKFEELCKSIKSKTITIAERESHIEKNIYEQLFPHMNINLWSENLIDRKIVLLSMMVIRLALYNIGVIGLDDRDSWMHKRLDAAGKSFETKFIKEYSNVLRHIEKDFDNKNVNYDALANDFSMKSGELSNKLSTCFTPGKWSTKSDAYRNITDDLSRANITMLHSHLTRVVIPSKHKGANTKLRNVVMSQAGYICPNESPEGAKCGLLLNLAITAFISYDTDINIVYECVRPYCVSAKTIEMIHPLIINGIYVGWCNGPLLRQQLVKMRRRRELHEHTCVVFEQYALHVYCDASRPVRPLLIVNTDTHQLVIEEKDMWNASFAELLLHGCVEYVDAWEQVYLYIADSYKTLKTRYNEYKMMENAYTGLLNEPELTGEYNEIRMSNIKLTETMLDKATKYINFTHCELSPCAILGITSYMIPMAHTNQAVRTAYACNMSKQALSGFHSHQGYRFDGDQRTIMFPSASLFRTKMDHYLNTDYLPSGNTIVLAISTYLGITQEDAVVIKKEAIDNGLFRLVIYTCYTVTIARQNNYYEVLCRPNVTTDAEESKYEWIDADGLPYDMDHVFTEGECIIGRMRIYTSGSNMVERVENASIHVEFGVKGKIDKILVTNIDNKKVITVKLRDVRRPQEGDKITDRYSQKKTIGAIIPAADLPFTESGIIPDIIVNPLQIPSRQTLGLLYEMLSSKATAMVGDRIYASAFRDFDLNEFQRMLLERGFSPTGDEKLYDGMTGKEIPGTIFMGPCYVYMLKHLVERKIQFRSAGMKSIRTGQPIKGRVRHGGLRYGEMERDVMIAHATPHLLFERMFISSDKYSITICIDCGQVVGVDTSVLITPETNIEFKCKKCMTSNFGKIDIPYVFKLLQQLLLGMGIKISLRTKIINNKINVSLENHPDFTTDIDRDSITILETEDTPRFL